MCTREAIQVENDVYGLKYGSEGGIFQALGSEDIKSVTENDGSFSPDDPDIRS